MTTENFLFYPRLESRHLTSYAENGGGEEGENEGGKTFVVQEISPFSRPRVYGSKKYCELGEKQERLYVNSLTLMPNEKKTRETKEQTYKACHPEQRLKRISKKVAKFQGTDVQERERDKGKEEQLDALKFKSLFQTFSPDFRNTRTRKRKK